MKLNGQDKSFELWVVDYQFRDNKNDEYDSNWLTIGIRLKGFKREWTTLLYKCLIEHKLQKEYYLTLSLYVRELQRMIIAISAKHHNFRNGNGTQYLKN